MCGEKLAEYERDFMSVGMSVSGQDRVEEDNVLEEGAVVGEAVCECIDGSGCTNVTQRKHGAISLEQR